jgi:hypothetical protein
LLGSPHVQKQYVRAQSQIAAQRGQQFKIRCAANDLQNTGDFRQIPEMRRFRLR